MDKISPTKDPFDSLAYQGSVCISGLTAAGKTTHCHMLAGEFGLTYVSGSQIQLNFLGISPVQSKDFWISEEAKPLWSADSFRRIDSELLRLESISEGYIFDTSTMPWRHRRPAFCIWLGSSLESRVIKSIVSHRGRSRFASREYEQRIREKDVSTITLYKALYNIDIESDLSCFDLILDISSLISEPSLESSLKSISVAHSLIRPAVGWYLTRNDDFRVQFERAVASCPGGIVVHFPMKLARVTAAPDRSQEA